MNHCKKFLAFFLVLALVVQMLPLGAFAENAKNETSKNEADKNEIERVEESRINTSDSEQDAFVTGEMSALRTSNEKHFRLSDGTFIAVDYGMPVHYKAETSGVVEWMDIDNTLTIDHENGVYRAENGSEIKSFAEKLTPDSTLFSSSFEDYRVSMALMQPTTVERMTASEEETAIEAPVIETEAANDAADTVPETEEAVEATAEATAVDAAEIAEPDVTRASDDAAEAVVADDAAEAGEATVSSETVDVGEASMITDAVDATVTSDTADAASDAEQSAVTASSRDNDESQPADENQKEDAAQKIQGSTAELVKEETERDAKKELGSISEQVELPKLSSTILYREFLPGVDLQYNAYGQNIKENILVNAPQKEYNYSFFLALEGLIPTVLESGAIVLSNKDGEDIYMIPAPYMIDGAGEYSDAVEYKLVTVKNGYILTVCADEKWINEKERSFPVNIDPALILLSGGTQDDIVSNFVIEQNPSLHCNGSQLYMGNYGGNGKNMHAYLYFKTLPAIPSNCSVIGASFSLYKMAYDGTLSKFYGQVHEVTGTKPSDYSTYTGWIYGITWNTAPSFSDTVEDYAELYPTGDKGKPITWDISRLVCKWYDERTENRTIAITPYSPGGFNDKNHAGAAFYTFTGKAEYRPKFIVQYRNNVGLEGYYTYQTVDAGRAGTGYIGDYTSQLTLANTIVSSNSATLPFSITAYYNSANRNTFFTDNEAAGIHSVNYNKMKVGAGWKLSIQESIRAITVATADASLEYYVYNDADGSEHYFLKSGAQSPYKDEDGLGFELTVNGTTFTLKDQKDNKKEFYNGYLGKILDSNGNAIYLCYNDKDYSASNTNWQPKSGTENYVSKIVRVNDNGSAADVVTTLYTFVYIGGYLQHIDDVQGNETWLGYKEINGLQRMFRFTFPDGCKAEYAYNTDGTMTKAYDCEAQVGIGFSYRDFSGAKCPWRVREFVASSVDGAETVGSQWHFWVYDRGLKEYRFYGPDQQSDTADDVIARYVFDHTGKTVTITNYDYDKSNILGVTNTSYTSNTNTKTKNRVSGASATGNVAVNLLNNSGFENQDDEGDYVWTVAKTSGASNYIATAFRTCISEISPNVMPHTGNYLLKTYLNNSKVSNTACNSYIGMYQKVYLKAGTTYVFSGWANTRNIARFGYKGGLALQFRNTSGTVLAESDLLDFVTSYDINAGWSRLEVSFTPTSSGWYHVYAVQKNAAGCGAFDDMQLETNKSNAAVSGASTANLVQLGSYELWNGTTADRSRVSAYWTNDTLTATPNASGALPESGYSMYILGNPTEKRRASQIIPINKPSDTTFVLTAWGMATSAPNCASASEMKEDNSENKRFFGLIAKINYAEANTDPDYIYLTYDCNYTGWQYSSATVAPKKAGKTISTLEISTAYDYNVNEARFDNISLVEEPAQTYTYDDKGNLKSVSSTGNGTDSYTYSGADLTKEVAGGYGTYTYTYDSAHNMTSSTNGNYQMTVSYDAAGNTTGTVFKNKANSNSLFLKTSAEYTADQNQIKKATDTNGGVTSYFYDSLGRVTSTTVKQNDTTNITTNNEYYSGSNRQSASGIAEVAKLFYGYSNGCLTDFSRHALSGSSRPWQQYHMNTDAWGNVTSIQVRSSSSTSATAPTSWSTPIELAKYTYAGNNGYLSVMTYANGDYETYSYDRYGRTDTIKHFNSGRVLQYSESFVYDGSGNTAKSVVKNASGSEVAVYRYEYDSLGRLIRSKQSGSSVSQFSSEHQYDQENRLTKQSYQLGGKSFTETYKYDSVKQSDGSFKGDGSMTEMQTTSGSTLTLAYDMIRRLQTLTAKNGTSTVYTKGYTYRTISGKQTTMQVNALNYSGFTNAPSFQYTYNANGTIASEGQNNNVPRTYLYDKLGQLTYASNSGRDLHYNYTYDSAGNILSVEVLGTLHSSENYYNTYSYENESWADLLTAFNGKKIAYEGQTYYTNTGAVTGTAKSGNPISYYNGNRWTFSWQNGRQLASANKTGTTISYTYDQNCLRTSKTVDGIRHDYVYASGRLLRETYGNVTLDFSYGLNGTPYSLTYTNGSNAPVTYYYITNLQNDVMYMVNASGTKVAEYEYDPFGKVVASRGSMASVNPLRYRGYYYDTETGFYYLQSRYYDPAICRFVNADSYASTGQSFLGHNMFAYCENQPTNCDDQAGNFLNTLLGAVVGAVVAVVSRDDGESVGEALLRGATTGAVAGAALDISIATGGAAAPFIAAAGGFVSSAADTCWEAANNGNPITAKQVLIDGAIGAATNMLFMGMGKTSSTVTKKTVKEVVKATTKNSLNELASRAGKTTIKTIFRGVCRSHLSTAIQTGMNKVLSICFNGAASR